MDAGGGFVAGAIVGKLLLDKTQWAASVTSVKADQSSLSGGAAKIASAFKDMGQKMTLAGGTILGVFSGLIFKNAAAREEIFKLSQKTGISVEMLSSMRLAAEQSDISMSGLGLSLGFLSKKMFEASTGGSEQRKIFDALKISSDAIAKGDLNEVLMETAARFKEMPDGGVKSALAMELFGKRGREMIPFLNLGRTGIEELRKEAERLGITFSTKDAQASQELMDRMKALKLGFQGAGSALATQLIPVATAFVQKATEIVIKVKDWIAAHPQLTKQIATLALAGGGLLAVLGPILMILPGLITAFTTLAGPIGLISLAVAAGTVVWLGYKAAMEEVRNASIRLEDQEKKLEDKLTLMGKAAGLTTAELYNLGAKYKGNLAVMAMAIKQGKEGETLQKALADVSKKHKEKIDEQTKAQHQLNIKTEQFKIDLDALKAPQQTFIEFMGSVGINTIDQYKKRIQTLSEFMKELKTKFDSHKITLLDYKIAMGVAEQETYALSMRLQGLGGQLDETETHFTLFSAFLYHAMETAKNITESFEQNFINAISESFMALSNFTEGVAASIGAFGKVFASFIGAVITDILRLTIIEQIAAKKGIFYNMYEAISDVMKWYFKTVPPPFSFILAAASIGLVTALFSKLTKFEGGGLVPETGPAIVHKGERILSVEEVRAGARIELVFAPVFNISTLDPMTTRDVVREKIGPELLDMLNARLLQSEFRRALGVRT